jgi:cyclomaltodextrinase
LYQLHSLGASGVPATNPDVDETAPVGAGLGVLHGWLDHVEVLGCGGVLLTPVFASSTHGYDTVDPFRIDPRLGSDDDFRAFVGACHDRDLRLILDGVFNHVGRDFPRFRDVRRRGASSPYADWFHIDWSAGGDGGFDYRCFEGHRALVTLNHRNPAVLDWAAAVSGHWLERGADGWRLDASYAIPPDFLRDLTTRIRGDHADAFLFGEMIHGDYSRFVTATGLDSVTQYELHKAIWSSLNDANFFELAWALKRHQGFVDLFDPVTFVGNHDVTRLASQLDDPDRVAAAVAILFTVPGVPCVYYGDELGWRGVKEDRAGGDDAIRPALPSTSEPSDPYQSETLACHRALIAMRRARPWLSGSTLDVVELANRRVVYTVAAAGERLCLVVDLDQRDVDLPTGWQPIVTGVGFSVGEPASPTADVGSAGGDAHG